MEMGAPIDMARVDQAPCLPWHTDEFPHRLRDASNGSARWARMRPDAALRWNPSGVVGLITPWNWPMNQIALKVIPALLAGCTLRAETFRNCPLSALAVR